MKKWLAILLTLCLLMPSVAALATATVAVSAGSETTNALDTDNPGIASMVSLGDAVYLLYQNGNLSRLDPATRTETLLGKAYTSTGTIDATALSDALTAAGEPALTPMELLFVNDGKLYGLCVGNATAYTLLDDTGAYAPVALPVQMDTAAFIGADGESSRSILSACGVDGMLYYITRDDAAGSTNTSVGAIELATGKAKAYTVQNLQNLTPYKDGTLLARQYDMTALYAATSNDNLPQSAYGTFDPTADTFTALGEIPVEGMLGGYGISGFSYDAAKDTAFYVSGSRVEGMTIATGETRTSAYTSEGMLGNLGGSQNAILVGGSYYLTGSSSGWLLYALDTDAVKNGALRIFGEFGSDAHKSFAKNYPDIPVEVAAEYTTSLESLANAMVSENNAYDVLLLMMSYMPVGKLIQKGYCIDLSQYPEIMERVNKLDARFVDGMMSDGKLYGVPVNSTAFTYGVNMENWQALGLTQEDLPTDLLGFYDFIANYLADYGEDNPDLRLFDLQMGDLKTMLFSLMLDNYITYCQSTMQGDTVFDSDMVRQILNAFEQIDFEELNDTMDADTAAYTGSDSLFSIYMPLTSFSSYYDSYTPLILSLTPDVQPVLGANLSVLVINPKSKRVDDAIKYLCNYLDNLDDSNAIVLNPEDNEPRLSKTYDKDAAALTEEIAKAQTRLDAAEDSQKPAIQDELDQLNVQREELDKNKYTVTAEQISRFRTMISDKLVVCQQSVLYGADEDSQNELNSLIMQYLDGSTTQEQFLKEMDKRARMMTLEDQ